MENTEAMEQAPKSAELAVANGEASGSGVSSLADQRRRRLVRGAAAFAPMVLTLRSGALAAASCTGAKVVEITPANGNGRLPTNIGIKSGDVCVDNLNRCVAHPDTKVITPQTTPSFQKITFDNQGRPSCQAFANNNVAILSSQSAGSMGIT